MTLSPRHRALALFGALGFLATSVLLTVSGISGIALDRMAGELDEVFNVSQATRLTDSAQPLAFVSEAAFFLALIITLPLSLIAFGFLIAHTGAVPRWLGWFVVAVSAIMTASFLLTSLADDFWLVGLIAAMGVLGWFALAGVWMLFRGTRDVAVSPSSREPAGQPQPAL